MARYLMTDNPGVADESPQPIAETIPEVVQPPARWDDPPWPDNVSPAWSMPGQNITEVMFQLPEVVINAMVDCGVLAPQDRSDKPKLLMAVRKLVDCYIPESIQRVTDDRLRRLGAEQSSWGHGPRPRRGA